MTEYRFIKSKSDDADKLEVWWRWLDKNRGDRAQLRRAHSADDVLITSASHHFLQRMPQRWRDPEEERNIPLSDAVMVATVLARVKELDEINSFSRALALPKEGGSKAVMSESRFQQLQKSRTRDEFFTRICRAVDLLRGKVNIISLANDILHWLHEYRYGPSSRPQKRLAVKWASDYYSVFKD